jgi:hypothetical protein
MMKSYKKILTLALFVGLLSLGTPGAALAYGGPGSIITGFGALLAAVAAVFAGVFGFVWFPLKRLLRKPKELDTPSPAAVKGDGAD